MSHARSPPIDPLQQELVEPVLLMHIKNLRVQEFASVGGLVAGHVLLLSLGFRRSGLGSSC